MSDDGPERFTRELARWSEALAAIARTGLGFTESLYERERFEEVLHVAADMKVAVNQVLGSAAREQDHLVQEWLESVGVGVPGTEEVLLQAVRRHLPAHDASEEVAAALDGHEGQQEDADEDEVVRGRHERSFRVM